MTILDELARSDDLVVGSQGNYSRIGNPSGRVPGFLITPSGIPWGEIDISDLVFMSIDQIYLNGTKPSVDYPLHSRIYKETIAQCVLHTHPFWTKKVSEINTHIFYERMDIYVTEDRWPPGFIPPELLKVPGSGSPGAMILKGHGLLVWGESDKQILLMSREIERICKDQYVSFLGEEKI